MVFLCTLNKKHWFKSPRARLKPKQTGVEMHMVWKCFWQGAPDGPNDVASPFNNSKGFTNQFERDQLAPLDFRTFARIPRPVRKESILKSSGCWGSGPAKEEFGVSRLLGYPSWPAEMKSPGSPASENQIRRNKLTPDEQTPGCLNGGCPLLGAIHHFWREHPPPNSGTGLLILGQQEDGKRWTSSWMFHWRA